MSSNELPRPISFDEIQVGDTIEGINDGVSRSGIVARKDSAFAITADNGFIVSRSFATINLLDRPVKRGPAASAEGMTLWEDPSDGSVWCRTNEPLDGMVPIAFVQVHAPNAQYSVLRGFDERIDRLVPFSPPSVDAELERLRSNVIEAAQAWAYAYSNLEDKIQRDRRQDLALAVEAMDQAGA